MFLNNLIFIYLVYLKHQNSARLSYQDKIAEQLKFLICLFQGSSLSNFIIGVGNNFVNPDFFSGNFQVRLYYSFCRILKTMQRILVFFLTNECLSAWQVYWLSYLIFTFIPDFSSDSRKIKNCTKNKTLMHVISQLIEKKTTTDLFRLISFEMG